MTLETTPATGRAGLAVEFHNLSTGTAPLTFGQRNMRRASTENPPGFFNLSRVITPPRRARLDPAGMTRVLTELLARHESLRTVYPVGPDGPRQLVLGTGRLELAQVDGGDDPDQAAEQLQAELTPPGFDDTTDLPIRVGVVTSTDGTAVRIVLVLSHLAVDQAAIDILERELRLLALRGTIGTPPGMQPRQLAARESEQEKRLTENAFAHWNYLFRRMPPSMFEREGPAHDPLCQRFRLRSRALPPALQAIAGAYQVSSATVLLAATATAVARWTGHPMVAIGTLVGNRFQAGHHDIVTSLVQMGMFGLEWAAGSEPATGPPQLADLILPTWQAAMRTYRHAHFEPDTLWSQLDQVTIDRGQRIDPLCCFNDLRVAADLGVSGSPAELVAAADAAREHTILLQEPSVPPMHCRFCMQVHDEPGGIALRLTADTRYLPPDQIQAFLRATEQMILETAAQLEGDR